MAPLLDSATVEFLESGCALLVGTVTADGDPVAARGWGCRVLGAAGAETEAGPFQLRVLLDKDDLPGVEHVGVGDRVAVTATSVRTLRSLQMKGRVTGVEEATPGDEVVGQEYEAGFFGDVHATDGTPYALLHRLAPTARLAWLVDVREVFDQTPGPTAGVPMPSAL